MASRRHELTSQITQVLDDSAPVQALRVLLWRYPLILLLPLAVAGQIIFVELVVRLAPLANDVVEPWLTQIQKEYPVIWGLILGFFSNIVTRFLTLFLTLFVAPGLLVLLPPIRNRFAFWLRAKLLPNLPILADTRHLETIRDYLTIEIENIKKQLPSELQPLLQTQGNQVTATTRRAPLMADLHGQERLSTKLLAGGFLFGGRSREGPRIRHLVDYIDRNFFLTSRRGLPPLSIEGAPGSGKSTIVFQLLELLRSRLLAVSHTKLQSRQPGAWIPLIVFVNRLSFDIVKSATDVQDLLRKYFEQRAANLEKFGQKEVGAPNVNEKEVYQGMAALVGSPNYYNHRWVIFFDGMDEFPDRGSYLPFGNELGRLINPAFEPADDSPAAQPGNQNAYDRFVVSCRDEDSSAAIAARIITLLPLRPDQTNEYLEKLASYYLRMHKEGKRPPPGIESWEKAARQVKGVLDGLQQSKIAGVLQNYIENPYFLSLIKQYHWEDTKLQDNLNGIFRAVLDRELKKNPTIRVAAGGYLATFLAPYCFEIFLRGLPQRGPEQSVPVLRALDESSKLYRAIFHYPDKLDVNGDWGVAMSALYGIADSQNSLHVLEVDFQWGRGATTRFTNDLEKIAAESGRGRSYALAPTKTEITAAEREEFKKSVMDYLKDDIAKIVYEANLGYVSDTSRKITRFRHRRLGDYFAASHVDTPEKVASLIPYLSSGWAREPLRLIAAISPQAPQLIQAFCSQFDDEWEVNKENFDGLNSAGDLLLNGSAAVAYLPRAESTRPDNPGAESRPSPAVASVQLYERTMAFYFAARNLSARTGTARASGQRDASNDQLQVYLTALRVLRQLLSADIWQAEKSSDRLRQCFSKKFRISPLQGGIKTKDIWKSFRRIAVKQPPYWHHDIYQYLYPVREKIGFLPISRFELFWYAADAAPFHPNAYRRLISDTHRSGWPRVPMATLYWLERITLGIVCVVFSCLVVAWLGWTNAAKIMVLFAVLAVLLIGIALQARQVIEARRVLHVLPWLLVVGAKSLWALFTGKEAPFLIDFDPIVTYPNRGGSELPPPPPEPPPGFIAWLCASCKRAFSTTRHVVQTCLGRTLALVRTYRRILLILAATGFGFYLAYPVLVRSINAVKILAYSQSEAEIASSLAELSAQAQRLASRAPVLSADEVASLDKLRVAISKNETQLDELARRDADFAATPELFSQDRRRAVALQQEIDRVRDAHVVVDAKLRAIKLEAAIAAFKAGADYLLRPELPPAAELTALMTALETKIIDCKSLQSEVKDSKAAIPNDPMQSELERAFASLGNLCDALGAAHQRVGLGWLTDTVPTLQSQVIEASRQDILAMKAGSLDTFVANLASLTSEINRSLDLTNRDPAASARYSGTLAQAKDTVQQLGKNAVAQRARLATLDERVPALQSAVAEAARQEAKTTDPRRLTDFIGGLTPLAQQISQLQALAALSGVAARGYDTTLTDLAAQIRTINVAATTRAATLQTKQTEEKIAAYFQRTTALQSDLDQFLRTLDQPPAAVDWGSMLARCRDLESTAIALLDVGSNLAATAGGVATADPLGQVLDRLRSARGRLAAAHQQIQTQIDQAALRSFAELARTLLVQFQERPGGDALRHSCSNFLRREADLPQRQGGNQSDRARENDVDARCRQLLAPQAPPAPSWQEQCEAALKPNGPEKVDNLSAFRSFYETDWPLLIDTRRLVQSATTESTLAALWHYRQWGWALASLKSLEKLLPVLPAMWKELERRYTILDKLLESAPSSDKASACYVTARDEGSALKADAQHADTVMQQSSPKTLDADRESFEKAQGRVRDELGQFAQNVVLVILAVAVGFAFLLGFALGDDRKVRRKLKEIRSHYSEDLPKRFDKLIELVTANRGSGAVNNEIVANISVLVEKPTQDQLRKISGAAGARLERRTPLNEEVGKALLDLADKVKNMLNRDPAS